MTNTSPIIISSPVRRSGTTLLQRLLTSSPNTLIYGESCANDFQMMVNIFIGKQLHYMPSKEWRDEQLTKVLAGDVNDWIPDILPFIDNHLGTVKENVIKLLCSYKEFAEQNNRPIWGMKKPEWNPANINLVRNFFPDFKLIYITRNIEDCVRSAKNVQMVNGLNEVDGFCQVWKIHGQNAAQHFTGDQVLHISYESLVENPEAIIEDLKKYTGIENIDSKVMDFKFNAFKEKAGANETMGRHISPADLTDEEMEIIKKYQTS